MDYALLLVQVEQRVGDLSYDVARELLAEVGEAHDLVEELAAGRQLEDDVVVLARLGELDELDDVRVVQVPHDLNLLQDVGALAEPSASVLALPVLLPWDSLSLGPPRARI